jgi:hypothetical protein
MTLPHDYFPFAGKGLPREFVQRGLRIESIDVTDAPAHEQRDDTFSPRFEMWFSSRLSGGHRAAIRRKEIIVIEQT